MITEFVTFALPRDMTREQLVENYKQTALKWRQNSDLIRKNYLFDQASGLGGGVYLWKTMAAAKRWHDESWRNKVVELYGSEPTIRYFETPIVVDNVAQQTVEDTVAA
jgi:hypothetical protein